MPITLLHFGLMAPFIRRRRGYAALASFVLINLWIDLEAILAVISGSPLPAHTEASHTLPVALMMGLAVALPGALPYIRSAAWVAGALLGAVSHVLLDALVHQDMDLMGTGSSGNPLYLGLMTHVSLLLVLPTAYVIARFLLDSLRVLKGLVERLAQRISQRSS